MESPQGTKGRSRKGVGRTRAALSIVTGIVALILALGPSLNPSLQGLRAAPIEAGNEIGPESVETQPVSFSVEKIDARTQGFFVALKIRNEGSVRLSNLHIEGQLYAGADRLERSVGQIEIIPAGAVRRVSLFFQRDPRSHELRLLARELASTSSQAAIR